jgi:hypothetical protein
MVGLLNPATPTIPLNELWAYQLSSLKKCLNVKVVNDFRKIRLFNRFTLEKLLLQNHSKHPFLQTPFSNWLTFNYYYSEESRFFNKWLHKIRSC